MEFNPTAGSPAGSSSILGGAPSSEVERKSLQRLLLKLRDRVLDPNPDHNSMSLNGQTITTRELRDELEMAKEERVLLERVLHEVCAMGGKTNDNVTQLSTGLRLLEITKKRESAEKNVEDLKIELDAAQGKLYDLRDEEDEVRAEMRQGSPFYVIEEDTQAVHDLCFGVKFSLDGDVDESDGEGTDSEVEDCDDDEAVHDDLERDVEMAVAFMEE
ncbi:hypothetical protein FGLOB1_342 [Fusarium globosum]|uniref:Uncharacterized protein n=1 Tax=Fusarium globosum TaxID=78864 RepID=A0A8H5YYT3_9HYPO|nr:hypothetical protein FGLOB1_342 [Fusarium globosum]